MDLSAIPVCLMTVVLLRFEMKSTSVRSEHGIGFPLWLPSFSAVVLLGALLILAGFGLGLYKGICTLGLEEK